MNSTEKLALHVLTEAGPSTAKSLAAVLQMDYSTSMYEVLNALIDEGLVVIERTVKRGTGGGKGRPARLYQAVQ